MHPKRTVLIAATSAILIVVTAVIVTWIDSPATAPVLSISPTTKPTLTLDFSQRRLLVQVAGTLVREFKILDLSGYDPTDDSVYILNRGVQEFQTVHLISAATTIPSTTLEILSEESNLAVDQIQRYIPHEMLITTKENLQLYIEADVDDFIVFESERWHDLIRPVISFVLGRKIIRLVLPPADAMSLYGIAASHPELRLHTSDNSRK